MHFCKNIVVVWFYVYSQECPVVSYTITSGEWNWFDSFSCLLCSSMCTVFGFLYLSHIFITTRWCCLQKLMSVLPLSFPMTFFRSFSHNAVEVSHHYGIHLTSSFLMQYLSDLIIHVFYLTILSWHVHLHYYIIKSFCTNPHKYQTVTITVHFCYMFKNIISKHFIGPWFQLSKNTV